VKVSFNDNCQPMRQYDTVLNMADKPIGNFAYLLLLIV